MRKESRENEKRHTRHVHKRDIILGDSVIRDCSAVGTCRRVVASSLKRRYPGSTCNHCFGIAYKEYLWIHQVLCIKYNYPHKEKLLSLIHI